MKYLRGLGLDELDPVELVLRGVLPKYRSVSGLLDEAEYARDIGDLVRAHRAGSRSGRRRLERELRRVRVVVTVDARGGARRLSRPGDACYATGPQKDLFGDLPAIRFVDDGCPALDEEGARALLRACGAHPVLDPYQERPTLSKDDREEIRSRTPGADPEGGITCFEDWNLRGLDALLAGGCPAAVGRTAASTRDAPAGVGGAPGHSRPRGTFGEIRMRCARRIPGHRPDAGRLDAPPHAERLGPGGEAAGPDRPAGATDPAASAGHGSG